KVELGVRVRRVRADVQPRRKYTVVRARVVQRGQGDLLQVVLALHVISLRPRMLQGRQEQGEQDADDGDHHQHIDQGNGRSPLDTHVYYSIGVKSSRLAEKTRGAQGSPVPPGR